MAGDARRALGVVNLKKRRTSRKRHLIVEHHISYYLSAFKERLTGGGYRVVGEPIAVSNVFCFRREIILHILFMDIWSSLPTLTVLQTLFRRVGLDGADVVLGALPGEEAVIAESCNKIEIFRKKNFANKQVPTSVVSVIVVIGPRTVCCAGDGFPSRLHRLEGALRVGGAQPEGGAVRVELAVVQNIAVLLVGKKKK